MVAFRFTDSVGRATGDKLSPNRVVKTSLVHRQKHYTGHIKIMNKLTKTEKEFLVESNLIEGVVGHYADTMSAWNYAKTARERLTVYDILYIHQLLMKPFLVYAGEFRNVAVRIGNTVKSNIGSVALEAQVRVWIRDWYGKSEAEEIKYAHIVFERIHPFIDGNGRVGRILYNLQRLNAGLPIEVIKNEGKEINYYTWFND
jgi:Fic family protein